VVKDDESFGFNKGIIVIELYVIEGILTMKDRFINGLVAGIVAGFVQITVSGFLYFILHFGHLKLGDFAGIMIFGRKPANLIEYQLAFLAHLGYAGSVGIAFSFLLQYISRKYLWVKGLYFGLAMWFFVYTIILLFKVPGLTKNTLESAMNNAITSCIYGLALAWAIKKLENQELLK
jgi:uncharacterized membrane protein YagU involved in acid resistance